MGTEALRLRHNIRYVMLCYVIAFLFVFAIFPHLLYTNCQLYIIIKTKQKVSSEICSYCIQIM